MSVKNVFVVSSALLSLLVATGCGPVLDTCETDSGESYLAETWTCSADFTEVMYCNADEEWEITTCPDGSSCLATGDGGECTDDDTGEPVD